LVLASAASLGAPPSHTLAACAAIELLHNYSLIHDDIEDRDRMRHGRETLWAKFGEAHGVNAGDAVGALAYVALGDVARSLSPAVAHAMMVDLAAAHVRMCQGQAHDLAMEGEAAVTLRDYLSMIEGKTVALFECAAALGARCATGAGGKEEAVDRSKQVGRAFGLGFQIADDIQGIWGHSERTGKAAGGDIARRKKTYPIVWAMERDPGGAARRIAAVYSGVADVNSADIEDIRSALERCGARDAATQAAEQYFQTAKERASVYGPLLHFVNAWSTNAP
jgi:geranylgeranyl diphosphate synthase type I